MELSYNFLKRLWILLILVLVVIAIVNFYQKRQLFNQLKRHGIITSGYVIEVWNAFKADIGYKYYFFYQGRKYTGKDFYSDLSLNIRDSIYNKPLPVIFLPEDPSQNRLMITEPLFQNLGYEFPDSLTWTKKYIQN